MSRFLRVLLWGVALSLAPLLHAQSITGTILGTVSDESGGALAGATLMLRNLDTGAVRTVVTDAQGRYRAPGLSLGRYEVRSELTGFQPKLRTGITLTVGGEALVDFSLNIGQLKEAVVVEGEAPLVNTSESSLSYLVDEKKIRDLPLNGRDFTQLILLQPGAVLSRASNNTANVGQGIKIFNTISDAREVQLALRLTF